MIEKCSGINLDSARLLIEKKISLFEVIANVSVTWWVTIVVLEATFVGALLLKGKSLKSTTLTRPLMYCASFFILQSVAYGFIISKYYKDLSVDMECLLPSALMDEAAFKIEIDFAILSAQMGSGALFVLFIACIVAYNYVVKKDEVKN